MVASLLEHRCCVIPWKGGYGEGVSAHLQTLKRAGLVRPCRERTTIHYRLAGDDVADLYVAAKRVALGRSADLRDTLRAYLEQIDPGHAGSSIDPSAVSSDMTVIDVRPAPEYESGHFPGAISIPLDDLEQRHTEIPADRLVVVYCRGEFCRLAREAAAWLTGAGIEAVAMDEGVVEWRASKAVDLGARA